MIKLWFKQYVSHILFICLLLVLAGFHFHQKNYLDYSGDEPRFTYYSYSLIRSELLKYPIAQFMKETGSVNPGHSINSAPITVNIFNKNMFMMNSIVAPLLYSPALFLGKAYKSWQLLRTAAFLYYCGALLFIWFSLRAVFSARESLLALSLTTLSLPQLAQMSLANTEQATIFFLSIAFYFLIFRKITYVSTIIGTISMCLVIWASMRAMPLAGGVAAGFLARLWMIPTEINYNKFKLLWLFLFVSVVGALGWTVLQLSFTGTISGSSLLNQTLIDKPPMWFLHRLFVPMLNHKNGILMLFPLVFAALLGFVNAVGKRDKVMTVLLIACLGYYFLIAMTDQSEGYVARLQFVLVEFFIIGLAFFIRNFKSIAATVLLILGATTSLVGDIVHYFYLDDLMENRQFGFFQQHILQKTHILDFGQYLIWDQYSAPQGTPLFLSDSWNIGYRVFIFLMILGFLLLLSASKRYGVRVMIFSIYASLLLIIFAAASLFVVQVPKQEVLISKSFSARGEGEVELAFKTPLERKSIIDFGSYPFWQLPEFPSFFSITIKRKDGSLVQYQARSMPQLRVPNFGEVQSITVKGDKTQVPWSLIVPINVYVSWLW